MRRLGAALLFLFALPACQSILGIDRPVGKDCTLPDDGSCGDGQMCDYDQGEGRNACRPIGTVAEGEACDNTDDCAEGSSCTDGLCRRLCSTMADCNGAGLGAPDCTWSKGPIYVCSNDCSVTIAGTCPDGYECELEYNFGGALATNCVPTGWFGDAELGDYCTDITECRETLGCWDADGDGSGECVNLCLVAGSNCPAGQTCHSIGFVNSVEHGLCITQ